MRLSLITAMALAAIGCSQPTTMTLPETPAPSSVSAGSTADSTAEASASTDSTLPGFDRAAAEIIGSGKFETATFALG